MEAYIDTDLEPWPSLPLEKWQETDATLHLWTRIVDKIRLSVVSYVELAQGMRNKRGLCVLRTTLASLEAQILILPNLRVVEPAHHSACHHAE